MSRISHGRTALLTFTILVWTACGGPQSVETAVAPASAALACPASADWITSPNPPTEIGGGVPVDQETNCQFYQFSWQWFLSLVQPVSAGSAERVFETYRAYQPDQTNQCSADAASVTGKSAAAAAMFVRTLKTDNNTFDPVLPGEFAQATGQALYDQAGNIVFYNILYSPNECEASPTSGYQPNTIEIKASWRQLSATDPNLSSYYNITATIPEIGTNPVTLGLVGFHLVINTKNHPEFVWATFEHKSNAPVCIDPAPAPAQGWSFLSNQCAQCLQSCGIFPNGGSTSNPNICPACASDCNFNVGQVSNALTGTPNQVCQVFEYGTDPSVSTGGNNNDTNRENIDSLNSQLVGPNGFLTQLPADNPLAVFSNYQLTGGLWTDGGVPSGGADVQRGSLELANTTMETFFQQPSNNCFSCHQFQAATPLCVSHIINGLLAPPPCQ